MTTTGCACCCAAAASTGKINPLRDSGGEQQQRHPHHAWWRRTPNPRRLTEAVSRTRRAVGEDLLPHATDGRYRVTDELACDATAFAARLRAAAAEPDRSDAELRAALALVTGEPFTATPPGSYEWAHTEGLTTHLVVAVADAAHILAERALAHGDLTTAWWATAQGLLAAPLDEQLHRDQMRIADARGDSKLVQDIMCRLRTNIDDDVLGPDADDQLHPATVELYAALFRSNREGPTVKRQGSS